MLMEGIEVLNQTEIMDNSLTLLITAIILGVLFFICVVGVTMSAIKSKFITFIIFSIFLLCSWIGFIVTANASNKKIIPTGKYEYEVTIDKSVPMTEFYEKYEIIEQRGEIFVIKEKVKD